MVRSACSPTATAAPPDLHGARSLTMALTARPPGPSRYLGNAEPSLDELLDDEVLRRLMARDGVQPDHLRALAHHVRG